MESISKKIYDILESELPTATGKLKTEISTILGAGEAFRFVVHSGNQKNLVTPAANHHGEEPFAPPQHPLVLLCHSARVAVFCDGDIHVIRDAHAHFSYAAPSVRIFTATRGEPTACQVCSRKTPNNTPITSNGIALTRPPKPPTPLHEDEEAMPIRAAFQTVSRAFKGYTEALEAKRQRLDNLTARKAKLAELIPAVENKIERLEEKAEGVEKRATKAGSGIRLLTDRVAELQRLRGGVTAQEVALENTKEELADIEARIADLTKTTIPVPDALAKLAG